MVSFGIGQAGFNNQLQCGTVNFFDGWVVNLDRQNPIKTVAFFVDNTQIGSIDVKRERPDIAKAYKELLPGFYGVCDIAEIYIHKTLMVYAIAKDGTSFFMQEYKLTGTLSQEEKDFRVNNALPDDVLMHLVVHSTNPRDFLKYGKIGVEMIKSTLIENGVDLLSMKNILDFGVGCGRVMRWWQEYSSTIKFWGCDINPVLVNWCIKNLDFGDFSVNALQPPSVYNSSQFDLIYLFSVFTHLTSETQKKWLKEFSRILVPGGILLVSVHGDLLAKNLHPDFLETYKQNGYCVLTKNAEGGNLCATYQSREFCEELFSENFEILNHYANVFETCGNQDLYFLKKKEIPFLVRLAHRLRSFGFGKSVKSA